MRKLNKIITAILAGFLLCGGCTAEKTPPKQTVVGYYLDTVITLTAYTEDVQMLKDALEECGRYEQLLSRTVEGSDVWRINHAGGSPVEISDETISIMQCARKISELSDGAFDITIAPVSMMWDFTSGKANIPDTEEIAKSAKLVDYTKVRIEGNTVSLPAGMMIDLGGIAKGYIADRIRTYLEERGVRHAILSFGGNIVAIGAKPDGTQWTIGIQDIDKPTGDSMLKTMTDGGSVVTSGIYERGFDLGGIRYHHLLDPETGWPVQNELASVTILSDSSMEGDALSTAAFILGGKEGMKLIESLDGIEAVFIARDRSVACTSGAKYEWIKQAGE